ncbi:hypothetical protein AB0J80_04075 [Actinoplanes sp. NPDC049548]|uniref:hypothetical protein n=1 Tax=Actinoplanes sp. NPDC049548 TaxID=3155152 RepID=UPI003435D1D8
MQGSEPGLSGVPGRAVDAAKAATVDEIPRSKHPTERILAYSANLFGGVSQAALRSPDEPPHGREPETRPLQRDRVMAGNQKRGPLSGNRV